MPRILALDDISVVGLDVLRQAGFDVVRRSQASGSDLAGLLSEADAVMVRSATRITRELIAGTGLKLIGRAGFSLDTIDVDAATEHGVLVMHSPDGTAVSAAEFTMGLLIGLARYIPQADASMRKERWDKRRYRGVQLFGSTLGVIGMGAVGRCVVQRARAFGMRVLVHDPAVDETAIIRAGGEPSGWDDLLASSAFLTVHVPARDETRGLLDDAAFGRMKDGIRLVNCSRGGVVDEAALVRALRTGKVASAAIDCFDVEPPWGSDLLNLKQVTLTPHLVASTFEAQVNVARNLAEQVRDFFERGEARGAVNPEVLEA